LTLHGTRSGAAGALLLLIACASAQSSQPPAPEPAPVLPPAPAAPSLLESVGLDDELSERLDDIMSRAIRDSVAPGAALAVGRHGKVVHLRGYGRLHYDSVSQPATDSTIWDLASLTKVIGTTTAAMILEEEGRLDIERPVRYYLPGFDAPDKTGITVRMLLVHNGGLEAFAPLFRNYNGRSQYLEQINARPIDAPPGTRTLYSDWDFVLLGFIVEQITGQTLDTFLRQRVWLPLGMRDTGFHPGSADIARIAPTELDPERGGIVRGIVHDENAWAVGGVAGHAGLFSSARDLAGFANFLLNGGTPLFSPATLARWTSRQGRGSSRALGWDTPSAPSSAGRYSSPRSFGHTGFTGTSIWIDPEKGLFIVLLTNRVNPTRVNQKHIALRREVADAVQQAVTDAPVVDWEARMAADSIRR
jgi:CubicO group peptidase (beta-lactamase class C family)